MLGIGLCLGTGRGGDGERGRVGERIRSHRNLDVYQMAFDAAMEIFEISKEFPPEEKYSLTDQIRRSSRSVCANISEATFIRMDEEYNRIIGQLVRMIDGAEDWLIK